MGLQGKMCEGPIAIQRNSCVTHQMVDVLLKIAGVCSTAPSQANTAPRTRVGGADRRQMRRTRFAAPFDFTLFFVNVQKRSDSD
jgi:hypothetical protein